MFSLLRVMSQLSSDGDEKHTGIAARSATGLLGEGGLLSVVQFVPACSSL